MPATTPWRKRPSGCTRPSAPGTGHRSAPVHRHPGRPGGGHQRVGALVQHAAADVPARAQAPGRSRGRVLPAGCRPPGPCGLIWDPRGGPPAGPAGRRIKDPGPPPARLRPSAPCQAALRYPHHSSKPAGPAAHTKPGMHETRDAPHADFSCSRVRAPIHPACSVLAGRTGGTHPTPLPSLMRSPTAARAVWYVVSAADHGRKRQRRRGGNGTSSRRGPAAAASGGWSLSAASIA